MILNLFATNQILRFDPTLIEAEKCSQSLDCQDISQVIYHLFKKIIHVKEIYQFLKTYSGYAV